MRTLLLPALLAGCLHERPEAVLGRYLRAESDGRYQVAWELLAPPDRAARPLEAYAADHTGAGLVWLAVARQTRFEFGKPAPYDARPGDVVVDVVATHPQMRASADAIARALGLPPDLPADEVAERVEDAERVIAALPVPQVAEPIRYVLRPDDRSWLVWIGLSE
ncbi:MAG TPA: hypothetical protein PKA64_08685, partial [Myxococcota bacterium]|nr:hypothetical protein [Myxococcota bacterium]